jgi:catechol 2,3-dioxygenase-like lactoylglutathione lyase family enzyme
MSINQEYKELNLQGLDSVIVRVSNILRSREWYQSRLGFPVIFEEPKKSKVVIDTGSATSITLWQSEEKIPENKKTTSYIIFNTVDAQSTQEELMQKGVHVEDLIVADFVKYFFFYDPDGNVLEACQVL